VQGVSPRARILARWTESSLLPALLGLALLTDVSIGLVWSLSEQALFTAPVYDTAQRIMPMWGHGLLLLVVAVIAVVLWQSRGRCWAFGYVVGFLLGGLWAFWAVLFGIDAVPPWDAPEASLTLAVLSLAVFLLHMLTGLTVERAATRRR
jgi:hypothetical protein